jgi:aminoglycoside 6'-N-acetyltransferase I
MSIRPLTAGDRNGWLAMRQALWPDCPADVHRHEMTLLLGGGADTAVFVSETDTGRLDGFVEVSIRTYAEGCHTGRVGYIEGWYVDLLSRGHGVGRALVTAAEEWALAAGCREMASDAEIENTASQAAHKHLGYAVVGQLVHFRKPLGEHF